MDSPLDILGAVLAFWYSLIASYGIAIIGLTVVVRLALFPLTAKAVRSQRAMSELQPQIKAIQAKHRDDRQKLNEELMAFYKTNRINPFTGCLPILLQMPVFIGLLRVLNHPERYVPEGSSLFKSMCPLGAETCSEIAHLRFLGMDIQTSPAGADGSFVDVLPYWVLLGLVVLTGLYQGRQMLARQTNPNPQVTIIARVMPLIFGVFSINFASGVVLYFLTSNLWQIGQQTMIYRTKFQAAGAAGADGSGNGSRRADGTTAEGGGMRSLFARRLPDRGGDVAGDAAPAPTVDLGKPDGAERASGSGAPRGRRAGARPTTPSDTPASDPASPAHSDVTPARPAAPRGGGPSRSTAGSRPTTGQRPSGRASGSSNRSKKNRKRR